MGCRDCTPTVTTDFQHQYLARDKLAELYRCALKEVENGWLRYQTTFSTTIQLRVIAGAIEPKNVDAEGDRLEWKNHGRSPAQMPGLP